MRAVVLLGDDPAERHQAGTITGEGEGLLAILSPETVLNGESTCIILAN